MEKRIVEIQDSEGNVYHPHTTDLAVFLEGGESLKDKLQKVGNTNSKKAQHTFAAADWVQDGEYYKAAITDADITSNTIVNVCFSFGDLTKATDAGVQTFTNSEAGKAFIYADKQPTEDITGEYSIFREAGK